MKVVKREVGGNTINGDMNSVQDIQLLSEEEERRDVSQDQVYLL
jgi:hypothetical protein